MLSTSYTDYIYQISGEKLLHRPAKFFDPWGVYLIVDKNLETIWIWAGKHSRLFHRYMAASWAGKLKIRKRFYNYKHEVIKQDREPPEFGIIINEINIGKSNLKYPGHSRNEKEIIKELSVQSQKTLTKVIQKGITLSKSKKIRVRSLISEIKELQMHIN
ncbi:MAG: hypothetical protein ACFE8J_18985, partial [Candidatus Heimdallarchaeota archaeon]